MLSTSRYGLLIALIAATALADGVPPGLGLMVMLKVLTYDAGFDKRGGDGEFLVLVPFAASQGASAQDLANTGTELATRSIQGRRLRFETQPAAGLDAQIVARSPAALLIPADTPPEIARQFAAVAQKHRIYTMSFDEQLVKTGLTVGVALNNGKPQVILNATAAKAIDADFSTAVMRIARVYQ